MPRVSVLVPVHNRATMLRTALKSALDQRFDDLEVIVAGDGCTDDSERAARQTRDRRVRWIGFPKAPGFGYANRARALAGANGELLAYLNPDDLWAPDHLERLVRLLDAERADFVFSRPVLVRPDGRLCPHYFPFDVAAHSRRAPVGPRLYFLSGGQVLHTRAVLDRAGGWDGGLVRFGDIDVWLRCRAAGARIRYLPHPTVARLPTIDFRRTSPDVAERLHARLYEDLRDGRLDLAGEQWPLSRRALGWAVDLTRVGRAKGPAFARTWATRWRRRAAR